MKLPFEYEHITLGAFGGTTPTTADFDSARVVILPDSPRPHDLVRSRHADRPARDPRRLVAHGAVGRRNRDRRPRHRHLHAAGNGVPVRDDGRGDGRDSARGRRARQRAANSRSCLAASIRSRRRWSRPLAATAQEPVGAADRRARGPARLVTWARRTATRCAMRRTLDYAPMHAGGHPEPVDRRSGRTSRR